MKHFFIFAIALTTWATPTSAQIEWAAYEGNPVIGQSFDIESQAIYRPSVAKWKGMYHMWYGKLWQQTRWIAYTSSSNGIVWDSSGTGFDNAVLGPSSTAGRFDALEATHGSVLAESDTLKVWYSGSGGDVNGIGFAWSTDGTTWVKVPGPLGSGAVLDPASDGAGALLITHPTVVKLGDTYHMWYVRLTTVNTPLGYEARLGYARSTNGLSWQVVAGNGKNGAVVDLGEADAFDEFAVQWPTVLHNGSEFELWYQGLGSLQSTPVVPRVGCARSKDGINWEKIADSASGAGECFRSLAQPAVLLEDGIYKMWYALSAADPNDDVVMYATSGGQGTPIEVDEVPSLTGPLEIYPNPTSFQAHVSFNLAKQGRMLLDVRDLLGRQIAQINLGRRSPGRQVALWNGLDSAGSAVPSGAYIVNVLNTETGARSTSGIVHVLR